MGFLLFFWLKDKAYSTIDTGNSKIGDILTFIGVIEFPGNISISPGIPSTSPLLLPFRSSCRAAPFWNIVGYIGIKKLFGSISRLEGGLIAAQLRISGARHKVKGLPRIQRIFTLCLTPCAFGPLCSPHKQ